MLITLEGIDGVGKSTVWKALCADHEGETVTFTREPTDSWYGEAIARSVGDPGADPLAELFLYTADHAAHLSHTVRPALDRGEHVVSDRYSDSRYAYQTVALDGILDDPLAFIQEVHRPWTRPPDVTIYLDADPETAVARSAAANKFERETFLTRVQRVYERLIEAEPDRFVRVDAERSQEQVAADVREIVEAALG